MNPAQQPSDDQSNRQQFQEMNMENASIEDSDSEKPSKRSGRRKIKIEYIEDKNRRHITFSKRKAGIMKKVRAFFSTIPVFRQGCSWKRCA